MRRWLTRILNSLRIFRYDVAARWRPDNQTFRRVSDSPHNFWSYVTSRSWWSTRPQFKKWTMLIVGTVGAVGSAIGIYAFCFPSPVEISQKSSTKSNRPILDGQEQLGQTLNELKDLVRRSNEASARALAVHGDPRRPSHDPSLESEVNAGFRRIAPDAAAGDPRAEAAIEAARESGDVVRLTELLIEKARALKADITENLPEFIQICREIAALTYLQGDLREARARLSTILVLDPDDLDALNRLGNIDLDQGNLDEAFRAFERILDTSLDTGNEVAQAAAYGNLALVYQTRGDLDLAEEMLRKSLVIKKKLGHREGIANSYGNLGVLYRTRGDLDHAEKMHRKSLAINEKLDRQEGMAKGYGNLGLIYRARGDLDHAEKMRRKSLAIHENLGQKAGMALDYGNLALIYQTRGDLERAEEMHRKALAIDEKLGCQEGVARHYGNLGAIYLTRGDLKRAEEMLRKALAIFEEFGGKEGMASSYCNLGLIYRKRGDSDRARGLWIKARDLYEEIGMKPEEEKVAGWIRELDEGK